MIDGEAVLSVVRPAIEGLMPVSLSELKSWFEAHGLGEAWATVRDYILNPKMYLLWFLPCFILERFFAVAKRRRWLTTNLVLDFSYPIFNAIFVGWFYAAAIVAIKAFYEVNLPFLNTGLLDGQPMAIQWVGAFLITDFTFYVSHYLRHKIPWLWYFHAIHHSQRDLNPITPNRAHFFEDIVNAAIRTIPIAFVGGSYPTWFFFTFLNSLWGCLIHSNVRSNLGVLGKYIVSPQYHRVHHSELREHFDMNFGERLTLWDSLFGTMHPDREIYPTTGVKGFPDEGIGSAPGRIVRIWILQTIYPFQMIAKSLARFAASVRANSR